MPEKKKTAAKAPESVMTPQVPKSSQTGEPSKTPAQGAAPKHNGPNQLASFESGMKLFHTRKLAEAREHFEAALQGPERDVAQRAKLHLAMCDRRLQQPAVNLRSAEDFYNYGVALLNTRDAKQARVHLERALELAPDAEHVHYALAAAFVLTGDFSHAHENLKRAIELEPRNRLLARQDGDFSGLSNHPPFNSLLYPEKKTW
jgi:tetratricopeptide (TPR) repeat protein